IAGWEGWLAPAQCAFLSTSRVRHIERGQATLPNLRLWELECFSELAHRSFARCFVQLELDVCNLSGSQPKPLLSWITKSSASEYSAIGNVLSSLLLLLPSTKC